MAKRSSPCGPIQFLCGAALSAVPITLWYARATWIRREAKPRSRGAFGGGSALLLASFVPQAETEEVMAEKTKKLVPDVSGTRL